MIRKPLLGCLTCIVSIAVIEITFANTRDKVMRMEIVSKDAQPISSPIQSFAVRSLIHCAVQCQLSTRCLSLTFDRKRQTCDIFDKLIEANDKGLKKMSGIDYYKVQDNDDDTIKEFIPEAPQTKTFQAHRFSTRQCLLKAEDYCRKIGGVTARILSKEDQEDAEKAIAWTKPEDSPSAGYRIALMASQATKKFYWYGEKELQAGDFQAWVEGKTPSITSDACVYMSREACEDGKSCSTKYGWATYECADTEMCCYGVVCEVYK